MTDLHLHMRLFGHLARRRDLEALGHAPSSIRRSVRAGDLLPVRNGWVATREAPRSAVVAVLHAGRITGASALAQFSVWNGTDRRLHLLVPRDSHHATSHPKTPLSDFAADRFATQGVVRHWSHERWPESGIAPAWRVSPADALLTFSRHEPFEQVVAAIESALHHGVLRRSRLPKLLAGLPRRHAGVERELSWLSESGLETLARIRLKRIAARVECQVVIAGVGRVDILIDGWLVIEIIGDEFHTPAADRQRFSDIVRAGYRALFFGYRQVMSGWSECEEAVLEMLREGWYR